MRPTFDHTVSILVQAYLNDTLNKRCCTACAIGNLVAAERGTKQIRRDEIAGIWTDNGVRLMIRFDNNMYRDGTYPEWFDKLYDYRRTGRGEYNEIGYTLHEINLIEEAFERPNTGTQDEQEFNGLMAVLETLAEIHGIDLATKEEAKKLFVKA